MNFDFETVVGRSGIGSLLAEYTPRGIREAGLPSYWGAEFDFGTAPCVIEAVKRAADNGLFGFTIPTPAYLDRVTWWFATQRGSPIQDEWVLPTHGTIFSLATTLRAFTEPGEGMIVLSPGYMRYRQAADRLGRRTVESRLISRGGRYAIDFDDLEEKMRDPGNRVFVLCNPNNPTGTIWDRAELERIAAIAARHGVTVFSDEIFAEVAFEGNKVTPYCAVADRDTPSITCSSLGKSFGLTGVNHANVIIADTDARERFKRQRNADHYGSIDPFIHAALLGAYTEAGVAWLEAMREYVWENYLFIDAFFARHFRGVAVMRPQGTYVLWIDFRGLGLGGEELWRFLIDEAFLCLDRGEEYGGMPGFMRMNIAVPRHEIDRSFELLLAAARLRGFATKDIETA